MNFECLYLQAIDRDLLEAAEAEQIEFATQSSYSGGSALMQNRDYQVGSNSC